MTWSRIDEYRAQARQRYGALTPWRLGFVVGMAGEDVALCPYTRPPGAELFQHGHAAGQEHRERLALENVQDGGTGMTGPAKPRFPRFPRFGERLTERMRELGLTPDDLRRAVFAFDPTDSDHAEVRPLRDSVIRGYMDGKFRPMAGSHNARILARTLQWTDAQLEPPQPEPERRHRSKPQEGGTG